MFDYVGIIGEIRSGYTLDWTGTHGVTHWARVWENGRRLCELSDADPIVVELFALFHDSRRRTEHNDPGHGRRGAELAANLRETYLSELTDGQFTALYIACERHTEGRDHEDFTVRACWDSDRLDLGRTLRIPSPEFLCTEESGRLRFASFWRGLFRARRRDVLEKWGVRI